MTVDKTSLIPPTNFFEKMQQAMEQAPIYDRKRSRWNASRARRFDRGNKGSQDVFPNEVGWMKKDKTVLDKRISPLTYAQLFVALPCRSSGWVVVFGISNFDLIYSY